MADENGKQHAESGWNFELAPLKVKHADLERANDESAYRSKCPVCKKGVLMMRRDLKTARLEDYDFCCLCAQRFEYEDIDVLRKREGI